jgi:hypothetical protein
MLRKCTYVAERTLLLRGGSGGEVWVGIREILVHFLAVLRIRIRIRIRIHRIHMFLDLQDPDPDPLVRGMDPDPDPAPDPDPSIIIQK